MFAHLRSNPGANYRFITESIATTMREHARNKRPLLTGLDPSNANVAGILAEIHLRELACTIKTLQQVNHVAGRYHEHAFDNTDAYIEDRPPVQTHEMNAEQRHAAQLLLGVGKSFSEVNAAIRALDAGSFQAVMECSHEMRAKLSQKFGVDASFAEDALDRVQHVAKQVWSLVNMLAFSNLFRFADPRQPMGLPNPEDSIFIPYIPTARHEAARHEEEVQTPPQTQPHEHVVVKFDPSRHVCNECGKKFDPADMHHLIISPETGATEFYLCHKCGFKRDFPDEYRHEFPEEDEDDDDEPTPAPESESDDDEVDEANDDEANATYWLKTVADWTAADRSNKSEMNAQTMKTKTQQEQEQQLFNRTAELLADGKITPEQACSFIEKLRDAGILADDILDPENLEQEKQKGFNEIAGILSDWKITTEEACELFTEWMTEWKDHQELAAYYRNQNRMRMQEYQ